MHLSDYVTKNPPAIALARALGVSSPTVFDWCKGNKFPDVRRCAQIERVTNGAVRRWDLRPHDWHLVWPELIGAPGAPKVRKAA